MLRNSLLYTFHYYNTLNCSHITGPLYKRLPTILEKLKARIMNSLNLQPVVSFRPHCLGSHSSWALLSNSPYLSQTATHNIALCCGCCRHGDRSLAWPGGGVASVPVGILAQIHALTSRRTPYNHSNDRLCWGELVATVTGNLSKLNWYFLLMFSLNLTIFRRRYSKKWQIMMFHIQ